MDEERDAQLLRLFPGGQHGRSGRLDGMLGAHDVPDLDAVGAARGEIARAVAAGVDVLQEDELPLGRQVDPVVRRREERPGRLDARGARVVAVRLRHRDRPGIAADVEDRRDPRAELRAEEALGVRREVRLGLLVGVAVAHVGGVRPAVGPSGLGEVDVRVDQSRHDPQPRHVGDVDAFAESRSRRPRTRSCRRAAGRPRSRSEGRRCRPRAWRPSAPGAAAACREARRRRSSSRSSTGCRSSGRGARRGRCALRRRSGRGTGTCRTRARGAEA